MSLNFGTNTYVEAITKAQLETIHHQTDNLNKAADKMVAACLSSRRIFIAGTGHSHMIAEEGHYRAGGLACVVPMFASFLMIHESAQQGTNYEKIPGLAKVLVERYQPEVGECVIVFSYSGVNAVPVEIAMESRSRGAYVIGVSSHAYCESVSQGSNKPRLMDVVDLSIDSGGRIGDSLVDIDHENWAVAPGSTILHMTIWNTLVAETARRLVEHGVVPPVFISSKLPGAKEHNQFLIDQWRSKNPHL